MKHLLLTIFLVACVAGLRAQNANRITGSLQTNANFFITDTAIGATGTPQYDYQKFGAENWLNLNYSNWGFDIGVRFDMFNNSNLLNPLASYNGVGIGRWYVNKKIDKFELSGGYLYDQIGSGIVFRAYEERALMIDNALYGARMVYNFNENWKIKGFTGRTKRQFTTYGSTLRGAVIEGFVRGDSSSSFTLAPGFGVVARTYNEETANLIVNTIAASPPGDSIGAQYNTYLATIYNTLTAGNFTWYVEVAGKTKDVLYDPFSRSVTGTEGRLVNRDGYTIYTSVSYANKGLGITLEAKRTKDFAVRTSPFERGIQGQLNFLPPMAKQNTFRLTARFAPATQELGEQAFQADIKYAINKKLSVGVNVSDILLLDGTELYREISPEFTLKHKRKWQLIGGLQFLRYNMPVYQDKEDPEDTNDIVPWIKTGEAGYVDAFTPYAEFLYRFTPRRSLRVEAQYLMTDDEFGSWTNVLAELGLAPHWLIYVSDMYKIPHKNPENYSRDKVKYDEIHYPTVGVVYTHKANRYSLAYVKQVEGINCAGGICRLEPTFHGVRFQVNSTF